MIWQITPLALPGTTPGIAPTPPPTIEWVDPSTLLVEDSYQRNLSRQSIALIESAVKMWDWANFKLPSCARTPEGLYLIDGQHTAIAAASNPHVTLIPVAITDTPETARQAASFVSHNKNRIALTQTQLHAASVVAGDDEALTIQQVCDKAGVVLVKYPPGNGIWSIGESQAIGAIRALVRKRYALGARRVLELLVKANLAPVRADTIKAVDALLNEDEYKNQVTEEQLITILIRSDYRINQDARVFAAAHNIPTWKALTVVLFRESKRVRRSA